MNKKLQKEINLMFKRDQNIRKKFISTGDNSLAQKLFKIDGENLIKCKLIIKKYGWPTISLVGREVEHAMWNLIQHADRDVLFQKKCLKLLKNAAKKNMADNKHVAYLTDRILVAENKKQLYGTQFKKEKNTMIPFPIKFNKGVDKRRMKIGLEPMSKAKIKINKEFLIVLKKQK